MTARQLAAATMVVVLLALSACAGGAGTAATSSPPALLTRSATPLDALSPTLGPAPQTAATGPSPSLEVPPETTAEAQGTRTTSSREATTTATQPSPTVEPTPTATEPSPTPEVTLTMPVPAVSDCIDWEEAGQHVGERTCVRGTVTSTHASEKAFFINFSPTDYSAFYGVSFNHIWEGLEGRCVILSGSIEAYRERPQIVIRHRSQVSFCEDQ